MPAGHKTVPETVTRFAPSPSGLLHLGHAHAALFAWNAARAAGGRFLLRIEDIDFGRCRPEFETALMEDLAWLGLTWPTPVRRQSAHLADYRVALDKLERQGLLYPCFCTRRDIADEIARSGAAPQGPGLVGPDGPIYPGICRKLSGEVRARRIAAGEAYALRLDIAKARAAAGALHWHDRGRGEIVAMPEIFGDVVLARKDIATSYHLSVTVDDALQGVTLVTRGDDLFDATHIHRLLQALLGLPTPDYHHHALIADETGRRLAKRDDARSLRSLKEAGHSAGEIRAMAGYPDQDVRERKPD
jgi:glutamyl-Q tRNA(Asp) synthetase